MKTLFTIFFLLMVFTAFPQGGVATTVDVGDINALPIANRSQIFYNSAFHFNSNSSESTSGGTSFDGPKTTGFGLCGMGGYFLNNHTAVIAGLGYESTSFEVEGFEGTETVDMSMFNIDVGAERFWQCGDRGRTYGSLAATVGAGFGTEKSDGGSFEYEDNLSQFRVALRPSFTWFANDHVSAKASLGALSYTSTTQKNDDADFETTHSDVLFDFDPKAVQFGFSYWPGRVGANGTDVLR